MRDLARTTILLPALLAAALALGACEDSASAGNAGNSAGSGAGPTNGTGSSNSPDRSTAGTPPAN